MIKAGHHGAYIRTGDVEPLHTSTALKFVTSNWSQRRLWVAPFPVATRRFKNACGAGDCAVAGFLTALLKGAALEQAAAYAMLAGRDNLYGMDAFSGLSNWEQMSGVIKGQTQRLKNQRTKS
jgi:sugar/nucleoside kinase (ribokinase family)